MSPPGYSGPEPLVIVDLYGPPDVLSDTRLPQELDLNDWPDASIFFGTSDQHLGIADYPASYVYAEIHTLRPVTPPSVPGDFSGDRRVDAADYVVWRDGLGTTYSQADYDVWKANFGRASSIPRGPQGIPVSSAELAPSSELQHFVVDGTTYTQDDLIQPTLVEFEGKPDKNTFLVSPGQPVPSPGSRAELLTTDFSLNTGILNPANGSDAATLNFSPPLVNGPGPDLVVFDINSSPGGGPEDFLVEINSKVGQLSAWGPQLATLDWDLYALAAGRPANIGELENSAVPKTGSGSGSPVFGMAIDLDEFGVTPLAPIDTIRFGSLANSDVDPVLFTGIKPRPALGNFNMSNVAGSTLQPAVPEPASIALGLLAFSPLLFLCRAH
jgi:hypothetical protein